MGGGDGGGGGVWLGGKEHGWCVCGGEAGEGGREEGERDGRGQLTA